jgi:hypothetical protein
MSPALWRKCVGSISSAPVDVILFHQQKYLQLY